MNSRYAHAPLGLTGAVLFSAVLIAGLAWGTALVAAANNDPETISAEQLLAGVRENIASEPMLIKGRLMRGERLGRLEQAFLLEALLDWGKQPPAASYTLSDAFGTPLARLTVIHRPGGMADFQYEEGQPLQAMPLPDLNQSIAGTVITWNDLSLAFLWWPDGQVLGHANLRGRDCYIIELPVPTQHASAAAASTRLAHAMRLWVDQSLATFIQMEEYDAAGKLMRRLSVKNFKKIQDIWMIKNLDIRSYPSHHRTQIQVNELTAQAAPSAADQAPAN